MNIKDEEGEVVKNHKVLTASDYFGEISMVYGCKRTATVVSRKYSTLAKLTKLKFKEIVTEFPEMIDALKNGIYKYKDRFKSFIKQCLKKVDYFNGLSEDAIHDLMYNMELKHYSAGEILQKPGDIEQHLIFIQDGCVEVYLELDGNKFAFERLYRGSIINYRSWFMENKAEVNIRFKQNSIV